MLADVRSDLRYAVRMFARTMKGLLFGVTTTDATTCLAVPLVLAAVAMVSMWLPTRRALRVDPMVALSPPALETTRAG